ncbi:MAG: electron transfer flavoprotein subunit beta/FixA family protein [Candidatus Kariarchaeaceae archaeon]|jgi:electron transfer flavoprotein alpha/beta subunit
MSKSVSQDQSSDEKLELDLNIFVMIKQVPVPKAMKTTKEGLMDRSGKSMMNPHCQHALEEALTLRDKVGGKITVVSMGPPNAQQSLNEALRKGADDAYLLSDRRLAGSDTWATAEALATLIKYVLNQNGTEKLDMLFAGLQTIDGDTAHVGPQVAARLNLNQVTYVEDVKVLDNKHLEVRRIIEGGYQRLKVPLPMMLSISHTANYPRGPSLRYSMAALQTETKICDIIKIGLPEESAGLPGSPTVVSRVKNVTIDREDVILFSEGSMEERVDKLLSQLDALRSRGEDK